MKTTHHLSVNIDSLLTGDYGLGSLFKDQDTGNRLTKEEAKSLLKKYQAEGKIYLPIGEECDGFSYRTGCPGHRE